MVRSSIFFKYKTNNSDKRTTTSQNNWFYLVSSLNGIILLRTREYPFYVLLCLIGVELGETEMMKCRTKERAWAKEKTISAALSLWKSKTILFSFLHSLFDIWWENFNFANKQIRHLHIPTTPFVNPVHWTIHKLLKRNANALYELIWLLVYCTDCFCSLIALTRYNVGGLSVCSSNDKVAIDYRGTVAN